MHRSLFLALAIAVPGMPMHGAKPPVIELWPEGVPGLRANAGPEHDENGTFTNIHYPTLLVYAAGCRNEKTP